MFSINSSFPVNSGKFIIILTLVFALTRLLIKGRFTAHFDKKFIKIIFLGISYIILVSATFQLVHGGGDFSLPYGFLIFLLEGFVGSLLVISFYYGRENIDVILRDLVDVAVFQAFIILAMLFSPEIREILFSIQGDAREDVFDRYGGFRGLGFSGSVVYDLAAIMGFAQILITLDMRKSSRVFTGAILKWLLLLVAIAITGRTGFLCSLVSLLLILFDGKKGKLQVLTICMILGSFSYYLSLIAFMFFPEFDQSTFENIIFYVTDLYVNGGTKSTDVLWESLKIKDLSVFIFGMGVFNWDLVSNEVYRYYSDSGYIRHIYHHGFFITAASVYLYMKLWAFVYRISRQFQPELAVVVIAIAILSLIIQVKGDFMFSSGINVKYSLILIVGVLSHYCIFYTKKSMTIKF